MSENVSFKIFISSDDCTTLYYKPQIRRFITSKDTATSFPKLADKILSLFSGLSGRRWTISWKDAEGDDIVISSNDELRLALNEMRERDIIKLYMFVPSKAPNTSPRTYPAKREPPETTHGGIKCDECRSEIQGFRYKCIQCKDYDLCSNCESKSLHPEHCMIRTSAQIEWKPAFERCLAFHMMIK